jgi:nucleotide-binding universal stress UspA family protein
MRTILVPTDFSQNSKVALTYAIGVAKKIDATRIIVMHVIAGPISAGALADVKKNQDEQVKAAQSDGEKLLKEFKGEIGKIDVSFQSVPGFPAVGVIEQFAVKNKVNLIVMGSKGATGLKKIVMGSNATAVIDQSSIPVLVVPGEAKLSALARIVYATDAQEIQKEIKMVADFAGMLGAAMEVVHVVKNPGSEGDVTEQKLKEGAAYSKIRLHIVYDEDVSRGLQTFITAQETDFVLTTFTHRLTFNQKLFGKSVTQQLAFHNTVPLLVVNKSNHKAF